MRRWIPAALVVCAALVLSIAPVATAAAPDLGLKKDGELTVGSDIPYAPFEFYSPPGSKTVVGFDIDLVRAAARTFGISKVTFQRQAFDTIFIAVAQKRFDLAASSISITPQRAKAVLFSAPYFTANQSLMVRRGSDIKTTKDLAGKVIGAQTGTTGADLAKTFKPDEVKTYQLIDDAFSALQAGRVDAVVNDFAISAYATKSKKNLVVVQQIATKEGYGLAFPKGSEALRNAFNRGLSTIKRNGTYDKIYKRWFGTTARS
jgi:polar amino acid transport system substrate-binding protein